MRVSREYLVVTFTETADAMAAEKLFTQCSIPGRIIPVPRQLSAGCGLAWRTETDQKGMILEALEDAGIRWHEMEPVTLWA